MGIERNARRTIWSGKGIESTRIEQMKSNDPTVILQWIDKNRYAFVCIQVVIPPKEKKMKYDILVRDGNEITGLLIRENFILSRVYYKDPGASTHIHGTIQICQVDLSGILR
jgi:hypothetical protein